MPQEIFPTFFSFFIKKRYIETMSLKNLIILAILVGAAYYAVHVKGFNPFSKKIDEKITLYSLDGKTPSLGEVAGENGTFIFFMGTWCPVCVSEINNLKKLTEFFRTNKINILLCVHGESKDEIHQWVSQRDIPWDWKTFYWYDTYEPEFHIDVKGVPYLVVRNQKGKATFSKAGGFYTEYLSKLAQDMLESNK